MAMPNIYHHRRVAETASKPCYVCYKPTSSVLNQADGKDWFYICPGHLTDRGFATPIVSPEEEAAKKKREELEKEIEVVKKEYEEKMKNKKKKKGDDKKSKDKDKDKDKGKEKDKDKSEDAEEKEKDEKIKELESKAGAAAAKTDGPRIFALNKGIYQMRVDRMKKAQQAKADRERVKNMPAFPSVPTGQP